MNNQCLGEKFFHMAHTILENKCELELSEANIRKIKDLKINTKKSLIKSTAEVETIAVDIMSKICEDSADISQIHKLLDKKFAIKKESVKELVSAYLNLKKLLTKDQLCKLHGFCKAHAHTEEKEKSCRR